jgi:hypothetical protein
MPGVPRFFIGVDLGQAADYTAVSIVERIPAGSEGRAEDVPPQGQPTIRYGKPTGRETKFHVGHLERFELGMSYTEQAARIKRLYEHDALSYTLRSRSSYALVTVRPGLVVDYTGVGRGVVDIMRSLGLTDLDAVTITGSGGSSSGRSHTVNKDDLLSAFQIAVLEGWVEIAEALEHAGTLREEALNVKREVNINTGNVAFRPHRESVHDDLLLATALACWQAGRAGSKPVPLTGWHALLGDPADD